MLHTICRVVALLCLLLGHSGALVAATALTVPVYTHQWYDWEATPKLYELSTEEQKASAIIIKDKRIYEYVQTAPSSISLFQTVHKIIRINDDVAAENFNKVLVPTRDVDDFVVLKARAISPTGNVTLLNANNIKEVENVENAGSFKIFAIEGVEKGGEVEYFYTTQSNNPDLYGREILQNMFAAKQVSIDIISPKHLVFDAQSYNGFAEPTLVESDSLRTLSATLNNLPELLDETYANYQANLMRLDYKLTANKKSKLPFQTYTWEMAAHNFSNLIYNNEIKDIKIIQNVIKKQKWNKINTVEQKIIALEKYLKNTISIQQGTGSGFVDPEKILFNKYANELGMARLFSVFLKEMGIPFQLVLTSDKTRTRFDPYFESWNNITDILFCFPQTRKYIAPAIIHYRYGYAPYPYIDNYGLFVGDGIATYKIDKMEKPRADNNLNKTVAQLTFGSHLEPELQLTQSYLGYRAADFRLYYQIQKEEVLKPLVTSGMEEATVSNLEVQNASIDDSADTAKYFVIKSKVLAPSLIERAGSSYLFKVGEIIGGQQELYQEHERQNPIDMQYPIHYQRDISFVVPDGYTVKGLDRLKIEKHMLQDGQYANRFVSDYTQEGNKISIVCNEYYENISLPKTDYEAFREVINAAADFNKLVLVFEKK